MQNQRKRRNEDHEERIERRPSRGVKSYIPHHREKPHNTNPVEDLMRLLDCADIEHKVLPPATTYVPESYRPDKQLIGLLNHLFVRYDVPGFLYQSCIHGDDEVDDYENPLSGRKRLYRSWFIALAQGGSFPKLVKGNMTSKEAAVFLRAPNTNKPHENVWWAKMKAAGLPTMLVERLIDRIFRTYFFDDPDGRLAEVIQFYYRFHRDMNPSKFNEVTDFIAWTLRRDQSFRLKGRTASSLIKLSNQRHESILRARLGINVEWKGLDLPEWELEWSDQIWTVKELCNNSELLAEGTKQCHCVYSYVGACVEGRSTIFSMRAYPKRVAGNTQSGPIVWDKSIEIDRITVEVNRQRQIVQVRGPLNRTATDEEINVLRLWAFDEGIGLPTS